VQAYKYILTDESLDPAMVALMLQLPSEDYIAELASTVEVESIHHARDRVKRKIAISLRKEFSACYSRLSQHGEYKVDASSIAQRSLRNLSLNYLVFTGQQDAIKLAETQYKSANNMTDTMAALSAIVHSASSSAKDLKEECLHDFYQCWKNESLVVNQWFAVQASCPLPGTLKKVKELLQHEAFDINNPNKLRSLIGGFAMRNPVNFHERSGAGYTFLADQIIELNKRNPQIAARLINPLVKWKKYDKARQSLMCDQLRRIQREPHLSPDVFEVLSKSLT